MSVPVYRLVQIFGAVKTHHKVGQGHEYERIGRVHSVEITPGLARMKVLNNMGRYYDVIVKRATKGNEVWKNTGFVAACTCPDPNSLCKHIAASVFSLGRRIEADKEAFETWMGVSADDGMVPIREVSITPSPRLRHEQLDRGRLEEQVSRAMGEY